MSMSRVPWRTAVRCFCFSMEDVRPSMRGDSRHSTIDCQGAANRRGGKSKGWQIDRLRCVLRRSCTTGGLHVICNRQACNQFTANTRMVVPSNCSASADHSATRCDKDVQIDSADAPFGNYRQHFTSLSSPNSSPFEFSPSINPSLYMTMALPLESAIRSSR
jgi:hypothetical protein